MKYHDHLRILPSQTTGKEIEATAELQFNSISEAKEFYQVVRARLLNVNEWHSVAGKLSAAFQVFDHTGKQAARNAEKGDYLRIDIPGPGNKAGDGYDWVMVEELKEIDDDQVQTAGIRVRPSENPNNEKQEIAHFYSEEATGNFIVAREGSLVYAWILDRNTTPNEDAASVTDKIRDSAVGIGAVGLFSKAQWQALADGLINKS